jgi:hypothetical protein
MDRIHLLLVSFTLWSLRLPWTSSRFADDLHISKNRVRFQVLQKGRKAFWRSLERLLGPQFLEFVKEHKLSCSSGDLVNSDGLCKPRVRCTAALLPAIVSNGHVGALWNTYYQDMAVGVLWSPALVLLMQHLKLSI